MLTREEIIRKIKELRQDILNDKDEPSIMNILDRIDSIWIEAESRIYNSEGI